MLEPLHAWHAAARWTPPESLHLTLLFLGGVQPARVGQIRAAMEAVAAAARPVDVGLGAGGGRTGGRRGGVAWLDLAAGREQVARLAQELDERLPGLRQGRLNRPHLTVARAADEALLNTLRASGPAGIGWRADRIALWRSHTGPRGAHYEELAAATLRG